MLVLHRRYCAIVNPIRRHVAGLSAKPLTILIACLIWVLAIVLAMPGAVFSHVLIVDIKTNYSIQICSPFPVEFGEYLTRWNISIRIKKLFYSIRERIIRASILRLNWTHRKRNSCSFTISAWTFLRVSHPRSPIIYFSFWNAGKSYKKGMVLFKFLAYYAIPFLVITGFYLGMARHLELSTRNMPGELSTGCHRLEQIRARKKVEWIDIIMKLYNFQVKSNFDTKGIQVYHRKGVEKRNWNCYLHDIFMKLHCLYMQSTCK